MPISGVVITVVPEKAKNIYQELDKYPGITTYGIHNDSQIIAVFEASTSKELEKLSETIQSDLDGIIGIYPSYVNFEDEINEADGDQPLC